MSNPSDKRWILLQFRKDADRVYAKVPLQGLSLSELQSLFDLPPDNPMYDSYPLLEQHAKALQSHAPSTIDLTNFDYFLEQE